MIQKIISGGQTGADRAGLDAAISAGMDYGGWLPKGRNSEDGTVPLKYDKMKELTRGGYPTRTEQNVIDSDGTVIFTFGRPSGGSALTREFAVKHGKPWLHIDLERNNPPSTIQHWTSKWDIKTLNVAGSRESTSPGIYKSVYDILIALIVGHTARRR